MTNREMKSKVMSLGNRLAARMDRKEAFVLAWQIVRAGTLELAVKGVSFENRQEALRRLATYAPEAIRTFLIPELDNPVDPQAVAVMVGVQNGSGLFRLGYVPWELARAVSAIRGQLPALRILDGDIRGARLALAV